MNKIFLIFILIGLFFPVMVQSKARCKKQGNVVVCKIPKPKKCTKKRPCIPPGYYLPKPPKFIPMR